MTIIDLEARLADAQEQAENQKQIGAAAIAALTNPQRVLQINIAAVGVSDETPPALLIGQPTGELIRVPLQPDTVAALHRATRPAMAEKML